MRESTQMFCHQVTTRQGIVDMRKGPVLDTGPFVIG